MMCYLRLHKKATAGVTLIELMVAIAILAILLVLATPSLQKITRDNRVTTQSNELVALINLTRNEAIRLGIDATDAEEAVLRLNSTVSGWTGNVSVTDANPAEDCPSNVIRCSENARVQLSATANALSFESRGYLDMESMGKTAWTPELICLKHMDGCKGDRQHIEIKVLPSGQTETRRLQCDAACPPAE
ncbi:MAG: GspH/FimT family pseudopilin [Pirellulaceae bacterium]